MSRVAGAQFRRLGTRARGRTPRWSLARRGCVIVFEGSSHRRIRAGRRVLVRAQGGITGCLVSYIVYRIVHHELDVYVERRTETRTRLLRTRLSLTQALGGPEGVAARRASLNGADERRSKRRGEKTKPLVRERYTSARVCGSDGYVRRFIQIESTPAESRSSWELCIRRGGSSPQEARYGGGRRKMEGRKSWRIPYRTSLARGASSHAASPPCACRRRALDSRDGGVMTGASALRGRCRRRGSGCACRGRRCCRGPWTKRWDRGQGVPSVDSVPRARGRTPSHRHIDATGRGGSLSVRPKERWASCYIAYRTSHSTSHIA
ncbi:hypothetical protein C8R45DRAFT_989600 [Mycena sanguinolenta]|nr:hypothetical protein C8R45DRAFT_989600 [Mycena sanguinolenta]